MKPRYRLTLTLQERDQLAALTKDGSTNGKRFLYARALVAVRPRPAWTELDCRPRGRGARVATRTIERLKQRFVEEGLAAALQRKPRHCPPRQVTFDGAFEARLIALACSQTPAGRRRWNRAPVGGQSVELGFAPTCRT